MAEGSEEAFAQRQGLHDRELAPHSRPLRWTGPRVALRFRHVPPGDARLDVELVGQRGPIRVLVGGSIVAELAAEESTGEARIRVPNSGNVDVRIVTQPFRAEDGRVLGAQLKRVALYPRQSWWAPGLIWVILVPALVTAASSLLVGWGAVSSLLWSAVALLGTVVWLWPWGIFRSPVAWGTAVTIAGAAVVGTGVALIAGRSGERRGWGLPVALATAIFLLVPATSPVMVASDVVFQRHMLDRVARGDWFPTSVTQHAVPFRIPYGISFFALLTPLRWLGLDAVQLVRWGAALAGAGSVLGLFLVLASWDEGKAALAAAFLLLVPGTFVVFSQGNLPNAFGQAFTVLFLSWWVGSGRMWPVGLALGAVAGTAHLSSAIVLLPLLVLLLPSLRQAAPESRRSRAIAITGAALVTVGYYAAFVPLIARQVVRLVEGAGGGHPRVGLAIAAQAADALVWWGAPATALALLAVLVPLDVPRLLARSLAAFWGTGGLLFVAAVVSPLEVRYLYALTAPVAITAALILSGLWRRGPWGRILGASLGAAVTCLGVAHILTRVLHGYR
jgi:hypothetical protein